MKYDSPVFYGSKGHSQGQEVKNCYWWKGLVARNTHVKYQIPTSNGSKVMSNVKVFATDRQTNRKAGQKLTKKIGHL